MMRRSEPVVLVLLAENRFGSGGGVLDLSAERDVIEDAFGRAGRPGLVELVIETEATSERYSRLVARLRSRIVGVHFAGHATAGGILMPDRRSAGSGLGAQGLAATLAELPALRWVFLNGCDTAPQVEAIQQRCPVPIIATHGPILDLVAIDFAAHFYEALAHRDPLSVAFRHAEGMVRGQVADAGIGHIPDDSTLIRMLRPAGAAETSWPWSLHAPASGRGADYSLPERSIAPHEATRGLATPSLEGHRADERPTRHDQAEQLRAQLAEAEAYRDKLIEAGQPERIILLARQSIVTLKRALRGGRRPHQQMLLAGRWLLIRKLGEGGFAQVWKAWDSVRAEDVAVKLLHGHLASSEQHRARFFRGARQMAQLNHPHIVPIIEPAAQADGFWFFVMRFLPGGDLDRAVRDRKLTVPEALECIRQVAGALVATHAAGVIHRDVKPKNIVLDADGRACLTDFDLVRVQSGDTTGLTRAGGLGTSVFAAPECVSDASSAGPLSDIYSLGMSALFVLLGRSVAPQDERDLPRIFGDIDAPPGVKVEVMRAISSRPEDRHPSAAAFEAALRPLVEQAHKPLPSYMARHRAESARDARDDETLRLHAIDGPEETFDITTHSLVGRGLRDGISFDRGDKADRTVSQVHALISWFGRHQRWMVHDLGSTIGTRLDGERVDPGQRRFLSPGSIIEFGARRFRITGAGPPLPSARCVDSGEQVEGTRSVLLLPNSWAPEVAVVRGPKGWVHEETAGGKPTTVDSDKRTIHLETSGRRWRVWLPPDPRTDDAERPALRLRDRRLVLAVSADMETFDVRLEGDGPTVFLPSRRHHELLWLLVRARLDDRRGGRREVDCGWLDPHALLRLLGIRELSVLNSYVHRLRKQLVEAGLQDGRGIVERRRDRGLRVGITRLTLHESLPTRL